MNVRAMCVAAIAVLFIGCATAHRSAPTTPAPAGPPEVQAAPAPSPPAVAEEAPASVPPARITATMPDGWQMVEQDGTTAIVNSQAHGQIMVAAWPLSERTPRAAVDEMRSDIMAQPGVTAEEVQQIEGGEVVTWRWTIVHPTAGTIQGTVLARIANRPDYVVMAMGLWPEANDAVLLQHFMVVAATLSLE